MRSKLLFAAALLVTTAAACATGGGMDPPDPIAPTFEAVVEQVLTPKCTFGQCHSSTTAAAGLDLTPDRACDTLIDTPSCLFPSRKRVVPGSPDDSFFFLKLTGQGLDEPPASDCGFGSATPTNALMPFGAAELADDELELVHAWIAAGAQCERKPLPVTVPSIVSISPSRAVPVAGETISITVTLDKPAPPGGQVISLETNRIVLPAPAKLVVPEGATSAPFDAFAMRPAARFTLTARTGESTKEIVLRIAGLEIAEVLADPIGTDEQLQWIKVRNRGTQPLDLGDYQIKAGEGNYNLVTVDLTGTLPPGGCAVIGGPTLSSSNGDPIFAQAIDFSPNLPYGRAAPAGFALFDRTAEPVGGVPTPVDTMVVGVSSAPQLVGPDAEIPVPHCAAPVSGKSALRIGPGTCIQTTMQPSACD